MLHFLTKFFFFAESGLVHTFKFRGTQVTQVLLASSLVRIAVHVVQCGECECADSDPEHEQVGHELAGRLDTQHSGEQVRAGNVYKSSLFT